MGWISPTSWEDPDGQWLDEEKAYDEILGTYAKQDEVPSVSWGSRVHYYIAIPGVFCSKIRFWAHKDAAYGIKEVIVQVYYGTPKTWYTIYSGTYVSGQETEALVGSNQYITGVRFRFYNDMLVPCMAKLYECDFYQNELKVTTQDCTDITGVSALANGNVTLVDEDNPTTRGFCYMEGTSGDPTTANSKVYDTGSFEEGAFSKTIPDLSPGTGYRVRAYAIDEKGTTYGETVQLTTKATPTVTTQAVTDILSTTATGNGNITALGDETPTKRGVCWNITGSPTVDDDISEETGEFGTGAFDVEMTGLEPGVHYYVKAYAYNEVGYAYGEEVEFDTDKVAPTVTTQDATEIGQNQVKGNGNITASGGEDATERGFEYGLTQTATWTKKETVGGYGTGAFSLVIDSLEVNTNYWYRAYAVNSIGTSYGAWVEFQTAASGTIPTGAVLDICADYSGYTYQLHGAETDDGETYESYFVLSTDLTDKQALHFYKRLEDLFSYFRKKESGTCKIYVKRDNEATWQYAGEVSMTGDEDILVKHLPSENEDTTGDVDFLAKHFLIKFAFESDFGFIGLVNEFIPGGER